jgi:hypothetical protein
MDWMRCTSKDGAGGYRDTATSTASAPSSAAASTFFLIALIFAGVVFGSSSYSILVGVSAAPQSAALAGPYRITSVEWRNKDGSWTMTTGSWSRPVLPDHAELALQ